MNGGVQSIWGQLPGSPSKSFSTQKSSRQRNSSRKIWGTVLSCVIPTPNRRNPNFRVIFESKEKKNCLSVYHNKTQVKNCYVVFRTNSFISITKVKWWEQEIVLDTQSFISRLSVFSVNYRYFEYEPYHSGHKKKILEWTHRKTIITNLSKWIV